MYYSLTFENGKNTWDNWRLIPNTPPVVPPPEPVTNYVDVPGRSEGPVDLTTAIFNKIVYKRITGAWTFLRNPDTTTTRITLYEDMRRSLHGRVMKVYFEEDPGHYFVGRFGVSAPTTGVGPMQINITYDLIPVRYNLDGSKDTTYIDDSAT